MFTAARIKLTLWYLLIIMVISLLFSTVIYQGITQELDHFEHLTVIRREDDFFGTRIRRVPAFDPTEISQTRSHLILTLILVNLSILGASSILGYFLAGKTLRPIKEMVEDQNRFVADASHELRTPLTALKTSIEVTLRDKKLTLAQSKEQLADNLVEVNNLQYLSDNLLMLTQFDNTTNNSVHFSNFSLKTAVQEATKKVAAKAQDKKIALEFALTDEQIYGDKNSIVELLVILLDNAIKYSPSDKTVTITSTHSDHQVEISVADQGVGIAQEDLAHIFDRFYRADQSRTKENTSGYGLGLSIAQKIAELHKGKIEVKSEPGKGTIFTIHLPKQKII